MSKTAHSTNISDSFCQKSHGASESRTWRFCPGAFPLTKGLETPNRSYRLHAIVRKIVVYRDFAVGAAISRPQPFVYKSALFYRKHSKIGTFRADNIRPYGVNAMRLKTVNNNLPEQYRSRGPKDVRWLPRVCNALAAGPAGKQQFTGLPMQTDNTLRNTG